MEKREFSSRESKSVEDAVRRFIEDDDVNAAVAFLRSNREDVGEFCLQVADRYAVNDRTTPVLNLARLIKSLL